MTHTLKKTLRLVGPALALLMVAACASMPPPTSELAVSTAAVAHAAGAGANEAAPIDMTSARDKLARANKAMTDAARASKAAAAVQADSEALREELARKVK